MSEFVQGFIQGVAETRRGFFAPAIAVWRLLVVATESLTNTKAYQNHRAPH